MNTPSVDVYAYCRMHLDGRLITKANMRMINRDKKKTIDSTYTEHYAEQLEKVGQRTTQSASIKVKNQASGDPVHPKTFVIQYPSYETQEISNACLFVLQSMKKRKDLGRQFC